MRSLMLLILGAGLCLSNIVQAQETTAVETQTAEPAIAVDSATPVDDDETAILELSSGETQEFVIDQPQAIALPECDNEQMIEKVIAKVDAYNQEHPATSIMNKRNQALLLKNLRHFAEVDSVGFTSEQNYNVANQILMTKINRGLDDKDLRLCKNTGKGKASDIYLLIYPWWDNVYVSIINFIPQTGENNDFFIVFNGEE